MIIISTAIFLILSVLISLGSAQADSDISTADLNNMLASLEDNLVGWIGNALKTLYEEGYKDKIRANLGLEDEKLEDALEALGKTILDSQVMHIIRTACSKGKLTCNTFALKVADWRSASYCVYTEASISDVAIVAYHWALCWASNLSTVLGQNPLQVMTPVGGFGHAKVILCPLGYDGNLYNYDIAQNNLKFDRIVPTSV